MNLISLRRERKVSLVIECEAAKARGRVWEWDADHLMVWESNLHFHVVGAPLRPAMHRVLAPRYKSHVLLTSELIQIHDHVKIATNVSYLAETHAPIDVEMLVTLPRLGLSLLLLSTSFSRPLPVTALSLCYVSTPRNPWPPVLRLRCRTSSLPALRFVLHGVTTAELRTFKTVAGAAESALACSVPVWSKDSRWCFQCLPSAKLWKSIWL